MVIVDTILLTDSVDDEEIDEKPSPVRPPGENKNVHM